MRRRAGPGGLQGPRGGAPAGRLLDRGRPRGGPPAVASAGRQTGRRRWVGLIAITGGLAVAAVAVAELPQRTGHVDLLSQANVRLDGKAGNASGWSVAGVGDVNGDGRRDIAIGAPSAANNARSLSGSTYVVFGHADATKVDLDALGPSGFRIDGAGVNDQSGFTVSGAGDFNGDGLADVAVGAPYADGNARGDSGSTYIVFGRRDPTNVDLRDAGTAGFRVDGAAANDTSGSALAGIGDVNGDGRTDVAIGAPLAGNNSRPFSGSTFIVFGQAAPGTIDLNALGGGGVRIDGAESQHYSGGAVAALGDVNGDQRPDIAIGASGAARNGRRESGSTYIVYGQTASPTIDLGAVGPSGFRIDGAAAGERAGFAVAGVGDVNGDGRAEIAIGAPYASNNGRTFSGSTYVVFGRGVGTDVDLGSLGPAGFRVDGAAASETSARAVAGVGDVNGDGLADIAIGALGAGRNGRPDSGSTYVVYGSAAPAAIDLQSLGPAGFRVDGAASSDGSGVAVAGVGDVNGDGRADIAVGASLADNRTRPNSGSTYLVYGFGSTRVSYPPIVATVGLPLHPTPPAGVARTGPASFAGTHLPSGLVVDPASGVLSGTPVRSGVSTATVTMRDLAGVADAAVNVRVMRCVTRRVGNQRRNTIRGDARSDDIRGRGGHDLLDGGANEDCISGGAGNDTIRGGPAFDTLSGGPGADVLLGGSGNDAIRGGPGRDTILGGKGIDVIGARDGRRDMIDCGPGRDVAVVDRIDTVRHCEVVRRRSR